MSFFSRTFLGLTWALGLLNLAVGQEDAPPVDRHRELQLLLRKLGETRRLLYVTAHPDDEDAGLIARYAHGMGIEVLLLTLTRGEGGQNEIGDALFHELGTLRRRELMAAHRWDGAQQAFARAYDFGYSFSVEETLERWGEERVLQDIVRVVRTFQPDVMICLTPDGPGGGQHHQASGRLAIEAFERAADEDYRPELGSPHTTRRLFRQIWGENEPTNAIAIDLATFDPILGMSYAEVEAFSRGQHKCQGMVRVHPAFRRQMSRLAWIAAHGETPHAIADPFEGVSRPLLEHDGKRSEAAWEHDAALRTLRERIGRGQRDGLSFLVDDLLLPRNEGSPSTRACRESARQRVMRLRELLSGVRIAARVPRGPYVAAGETLLIDLALENTGREAIELALHLEGPRGMRTPAWTGTLHPDDLHRESLRVAIPDDAPITIDQPVPESAALERHALSFDPTAAPRPAFVVAGTFRVANGPPASLRNVPIEHVDVRESFPSWRRSYVQVVPDPRVTPVERVLVFPEHDGASGMRAMTWRIGSTRSGKVEVVFETSAGFQVTPERVELDLEAGREHRVRVVVESTVDGVQGGSLRATARRMEQDRTSRHGFDAIDHLHVRPGALLVPAHVELVAFPCAQPICPSIAYVRGTGDRLPEALEALGQVPHFLDADELQRGDLSAFDVIVVGVRAYKTREDLREAHGRLMQFVEAGGTCLVLYQKYEFNANDDPLANSPFAPYPARVTNARITSEEAPVEWLQEDASVWRVPNLLTKQDWEGWVQERGLYFLEARDTRYRDLVAFEDPFPFNAGRKRGALVMAEVGKGRWIYCGLALFRQLPAGVPGAYRLLANLLSTGAR